MQKTSVYIGLDFGTTFTKAAYEIAPSNVHIKYSIRFGQNDKNEDYYLPSVLYFDPKMQKLKIFDPDENCEEIRYFKYNMISDALKKNEVLNDPSVVTKSVKEELCSVFFLSYVIYLIRNAVYQNFSNTKEAENTVWYINMGVPLEAHKDDKRALVYKHVLEVAYLLEQKLHGQTEIDMNDFDERESRIMNQFARCDIRHCEEVWIFGKEITSEMEKILDCAQYEGLNMRCFPDWDIMLEYKDDEEDENDE